MPKFFVSVSHDMDRSSVLDRLQGFSEKIREDTPVELTDVSENWDESGNLEFSFNAMGMKISGSMVTTDSDITVDGAMPFAASMFRGAIETQIADKIREAIKF